MVQQPEKYAIFKWPPVLKVVTFYTNKEVRYTSGHLSEETRTNSTEEFRHYNEARKEKLGVERNGQIKLIITKQNR
jgi:hypothetical protein